MMRVSLVGTVHGETGRVTVRELQAILERSEPDVIFAEIPVSFMARYKDGSHGTLESISVARYLEGHRVHVEAVDLAKPDEKFFADIEDMFRAVERTSRDYCRMVDLNSVATREGGFPYLNSDSCVQAWEGIYREVLATVEWTGDRRLREICELWNRTNENRDREMVRNIARFIDSNAARRGVFLVGTAHRKSILDKTAAGGLSQIEWDLGSFLPAGTGQAEEG